MINEIIDFVDYTHPVGTGPGPILDLGANIVVGFVWPSAMTGSAWEIKGSVGGANIVSVLQGGSSVTAAFAANEFWTPTNNNIAEMMFSLRYIVFDSNGNEAAPRTIRLSLRPRSG